MATIETPGCAALRAFGEKTDIGTLIRPLVTFASSKVGVVSQFHLLGSPQVKDICERKASFIEFHRWIFSIGKTQEVLPKSELPKRMQEAAAAAVAFLIFASWKKATFCLQQVRQAYDQTLELAKVTWALL